VSSNEILQSLVLHALPNGVRFSAGQDSGADLSPILWVPRSVLPGGELPNCKAASSA